MTIQVDPVTLLAEQRLDELAEVLDRSREFDPGPPPWPFLAVLLGHRARTFFWAVRTAETDAIAQVLIRPLAELIILIEWLAQDPSTRVPLWAAESFIRDLVFLREASRTTQIGRRLAPSINQTAEKQAIIDKVRSDAQAAGVSWVGDKGSLIPGLGQMARAVNNQTVNEAYHVFFRATSPWTHIGAGTFSDTLTNDPGRSVFTGDTSTRWLPGLRALAASSFAVILRRVSLVADLNIERPCAEVQASLTGRPIAELIDDNP